MSTTPTYCPSDLEKFESKYGLKIANKQRTVVGVSLKSEVLFVDTVNHTYRIDIWMEVGYQIKDSDGINIFSDAVTEGAANEFISVDEKVYQDITPPLVLYTADTYDVQSHGLEINFYTGEIKYYVNWVANIRDVLQLQRFPFDRQLLRLPFEVTGQDDWAFSNEWYNTEPPWAKQASVTYGVCSITSPEWEMHGYRLIFYDNVGILTYWVQRKAEYYIQNFTVVVFIVVLANASQLACTTTAIDDRMNITLTLLLTLVAFKFVVMINVPKIPYMTLLDYNILLGILFLFSGTIWTTIIVLLSNDNDSFGFTDRMERSEESLLYWDKVDTIVISVTHGLWILAHIWLMVYTYGGGLRLPWSEVEKCKVIPSTSWELVQLTDTSNVPPGAGKVEMTKYAVRPF